MANEHLRDAVENLVTIAEETARRIKAIEAKLTGATESNPPAPVDGPWAALDRVLSDIETRLAAVERRSQTTE